MILEHAPTATADSVPFRSITPQAGEHFETCVPLTSLRAAAGRFGKKQAEFDGLAPWATEWITWDKHPRFEPGMFVARVRGKSMEPEVPDGAYCLFRPPIEGGSRQGKRLLVWHSGIDDPMMGGYYTLKVYTSEDVQTPDGRHSRIILKPINPEFEPIVLMPSNEQEVRVLGEMVQSL